MPSRPLEPSLWLRTVTLLALAGAAILGLLPILVEMAGHTAP
jgi:hypothetical protein